MAEGMKVSRDLPGYAWARDGGSIVIAAGGRIRRVDVASGDVSTIPFTARVQRTISEMAGRPQAALGETLHGEVPALDRLVARRQPPRVSGGRAHLGDGPPRRDSRAADRRRLRPFRDVARLVSRWPRHRVHQLGRRGTGPCVARAGRRRHPATNNVARRRVPEHGVEPGRGEHRRHRWLGSHQSRADRRQQPVLRIRARPRRWRRSHIDHPRRAPLHRRQADDAPATDRAGIVRTGRAALLPGNHSPPWGASRPAPRSPRSGWTAPTAGCTSPCPTPTRPRYRPMAQWLAFQEGDNVFTMPFPYGGTGSNTVRIAKPRRPASCHPGEPRRPASIRAGATRTRWNS